MSEYKRG